MKPSHAQNEAKPLSTSVFNNFLITSQFESSQKYVPFYYWSKICPVENMSRRKYVPVPRDFKAQICLHSWALT